MSSFNRRVTLLAIAGVVLATPFAVLAQAAGKTLLNVSYDVRSKK
jgi:ABC-type sulfate transport system substrate-binding protein